MWEVVWGGVCGAVADFSSRGGGIGYSSYCASEWAAELAGIRTLWAMDPITDELQ